MNFQGFIGPSYTLDSVEIDAQRCVNWYLKANELGKGKNAQTFSLIQCPGLKKLLTVGNGPIRGCYRASNGFFYVVSGDELYYIDKNFTSLPVGKLLTSTGEVDFADNGKTLVVVDGSNGYWHTLGSSISTRIIDSAWLGSTNVNFIDGYFLFNEPNSGKFYISALNSIELDALDFATAEGAPDNVVATLVNHREIWLFGDDSIETWYNNGNADFPFQRSGSGFIEMGCAAPFSVSKIDKRTFWIGKTKEGTGIVYMAVGLSPQRISTHAVELAIQSYGDISTAKAWTYQENGSAFYILNFDEAETSWAYNLSTGTWEERAYFKNGKFSRHRADCHAYAYDTHLVGDYENGNIYELDSETTTDDGQEMRRMRVSPHLSNGEKRVRHKSLQIDGTTGIGVAVGQGSDPQMMLEFSDDGGLTWSNEMKVTLGKVGNYKTRAIFRRLGASRDRIYRVSVSDPVKCNLIYAELELEPMAS